MKNKKGFTLIELLAVIVILAIIMVIAIPQILNVINNSRAASWSNNVKIIKNAIETTTSISSVGIGNHTVKSLCNNNETSNDIDVTNKIGEIVKLKNTNIKCKKDGNYIFGLTGTNNFNGMSATITCTSDSKCSIDISTSEPVNVPNPVSFSTDSWATIAANTTSSVYQIGDQKEVPIDMNGDGTPETYHVRIVNKATPPECSTTGFSQTACGFVLEFVEVLEMHWLSPSAPAEVPYWENGGSWELTRMRGHLNTDIDSIFNKLPADLQSKIVITTPIVTSTDAGGRSNNTSDKLYLLSTAELGLPQGSDNGSGATRTLNYYANSSADRIKRNLSGEARSYWLRSSNSGTTCCFYTFESWGSIGSTGPSVELGISPAFRIGN